MPNASLAFRQNVPLINQINGTSIEVGLSTVVNARDGRYGALGDDTTDDTAAIQAAITACSAAGGGIVMLPKGTYRITSALTMATNVHLAGVGPTGSILHLVTAGLYAITSTDQSYFSVEDLGITTVSGANGIHIIANASDIFEPRIARVRIVCGGTGIFCDQQNASAKFIYFPKFETLYVNPGLGVNHYGIRIGGAGVGKVISPALNEVRVTGSRNGIYFERVDTAHGFVQVDGCQDSLAGYGLIFKDSATNYNKITARLEDNDTHISWGTSDNNVVTASTAAFNVDLWSGTLGTNSLRDTGSNGAYDIGLETVTTRTIRSRRSGGTDADLSFTMGGFKCVRTDVSAGSLPLADAAASDLGGYTGTTGPGGGPIVEDFQYPYEKGSLYLATASGCSNTNAAKRANYISFFYETASGTFVEKSIDATASTISTNTLTLVRTSSTITLRATMSGGIAAETVTMHLSLIRIC